MEKVNVSLIEYEGRAIRVFEYDNDLWFVASDIEEIFGRVRTTMKYMMKKNKYLRLIYLNMESCKRDKSFRGKSFVGYILDGGEGSRGGMYNYSAVNEYTLKHIATRCYRQRLQKFMNNILMMSRPLMPKEDVPAVRTCPDESVGDVLSEAMNVSFSVSSVEASITISASFFKGMDKNRVMYIRNNISQIIDVLQGELNMPTVSDDAEAISVGVRGRETTAGITLPAEREARQYALLVAQSDSPK